jgi:fucose permease
LVRLNLLWAIGACACPLLTIRALLAGDIRPVLCGVALCFVACAVWTAFQTGLTMEASVPKTARPWTIFGAVPLGLIMMTLLITGIEASAGGWLATLAKRGGYGIGSAVAAPSCFWAGLLLSRLFWSVWHSFSDDWTVRGSVALMCGASVLLVVSSSSAAMLGAAFCMGFGIGPTYPLLLAWALRFHRGGAIFFLAGVGSACLPWLTGVVSTCQHSLRTGLVVPMIGTMIMLALSLVLPLRRWSEPDASALAIPPR